MAKELTLKKIYLRNHLFDPLNQLQDETNRSFSVLINEAIESYLKTNIPTRLGEENNEQQKA